MNKRLITLIVCFILLLILLPTLLYKPLVGINTYFKTDIRKIESITNAVSGKPLVLVTGTTKNGLKKGAWFDRRSIINFTLDVESNLENSISKEEALTIIKDNELIHAVNYLQLDYIKIDKTEVKISKGAYWLAIDEQSIYENGHTRHVYIDAFTKKYIVTDNTGKVIKNTLY